MMRRTRGKTFFITVAMLLTLLAFVSTLFPWMTVKFPDSGVALPVSAKNFAGNEITPAVGACLIAVEAALLAYRYAARFARVAVGAVLLSASFAATATTAVTIAYRDEAGIRLFREETHLLTASAIVRDTPWLWCTLVLCLLLNGGVVIALGRTPLWGGGGNGTILTATTEESGVKVPAADAWDALSAGQDPTVTAPI